MSKNTRIDELEKTLRNSGVEFKNWKCSRWYLSLDGHVDKTLQVFLSLDVDRGFGIVDAPSNGSILQGAYLNVHSSNSETITGEDPDESPSIFERRKKDAKLAALKVLHWKGALSSKDLAQYAGEVL